MALTSPHLRPNGNYPTQERFPTWMTMKTRRRAGATRKMTSRGTHELRAVRRRPTTTTSTTTTTATTSTSTSTSRSRSTSAKSTRGGAASPVPVEVTDPEASPSLSPSSHSSSSSPLVMSMQATATVIAAAPAIAAAKPAPCLLPLRFQCPLCLDVLRRPIELPCCHRRLCTACFTRALELTSVNCGFCRKRLVGMARKKQYAVDATLWREILAHCPFLAPLAGDDDDAMGQDQAMDTDMDAEVEFVDEDAPLRHASAQEAAQLAPGELKKLYEQQLRDHQAARRRDELAASQNEIENENGDAERQTVESAPSPPQTRAAALQSRGRAELSALGVSHATRSQQRQQRQHPPQQQQQQRLDAFFTVRGGGPHGEKHQLTRSVSTRSSGSVVSTSTVSARHQHQLRTATSAIDVTTSTMHTRMLTRSASHSPKRRRTGATPVQKTMLQLTLRSPRRGGSGSGRRGSSSADKVTTAQPMPTRRRPWRCGSCTFENTCFDTSCSMCRQAHIV